MISFWGWLRRVLNANGWTAIATILLVFVGIVGTWLTSQTLELSERAWVGLQGIGIIKPIVVGRPIVFGAQYINSGKEPATDIAFAQETETFPAPSNDDVSSMAVGENDTCDSLVPQRGGGVILPGSTLGHNSDTNHSRVPYSVDQRFINGDVAVVFKGCVAYRTFRRVRHTSYCAVVLMATPDASTGIVSNSATNAATPPVQQTSSGLFLTLGLCPNGNSAD